MVIRLKTFRAFNSQSPSIYRYRIFNMFPYKLFHAPDRIKALTLPRKRFHYALAVFLVFAFALFIRLGHRGVGVSLLDHASHGAAGLVPGVMYSEEDRWTPPPGWDPVIPYWENFTKIDEHYASGTGVLKTASAWPGNPLAQSYTPYPDYESREYKETYEGSFVPCVGPRGVRLNQSSEDLVTGYVGVSKDFPEPALGSSKTLGFDDHMCFERYGRFGAYGVADKSDPSRQEKYRSEVDWENVDWASLQEKCVAENSDRYDMTPRPIPGDGNYEKKPPESFQDGTLRKQRTAVLFRSHDEFKYTADAIRSMRSIIMELSLQSGGEYEVFLLVQVKDKSISLFEDHEEHERIRQSLVPKEFLNMTILWNEALWGNLYPRIPEQSRLVHISQWLPVQWFAQSHPNFDFYWNWEMDVRYTGHHYQFSEQVGAWTKQQPRKGMWERNSRFYVPRFHGDYSTQFTNFIQAKYETQSRLSDKKKDWSIWGPYPPDGQAPAPFDDLPPLNSPTPAHDNFAWGVGEEADLVTLLPMFNPDTTHYALRNVYFNYPKILNPAGPPRRGTIITLYRISHRLLSTMHLENTRDPGHHMSSEVWPQSVALHHGFKAIYAPHSIYMDRKWAAEALDFIFNNGDSSRVIKAFKDIPARGEGSGGWESVFGFDREHNFLPSTWYYRTLFTSRLYKRLLGFEVDGIGGKDWEKINGRYCLPPMLLHPIKDMEDPGVAEERAKAKGFEKQKAEALDEAARMEAKAEEAFIKAQVNAIADAANAENEGGVP